MWRIQAVSLALLCSVAVVQADIYRCTGPNGSVTFSDQTCGADENQQVTRYTNHKINTAEFEQKQPLTSSSEPAKVLYTGNPAGTESRFLRVSIFEETDHYIIFHIEGYYRNTHGGEAEFRVTPNLSWRANSFSTKGSGLVSGYARVSLGSKALDVEESDIINIVLWEYRKGQPSKVVEQHVIPFKKRWLRK